MPTSAELDSAASNTRNNVISDVTFQSGKQLSKAISKQDNIWASFRLRGTWLSRKFSVY